MVLCGPRPRWPNWVCFAQSAICNPTTPPQADAGSPVPFRKSAIEELASFCMISSNHGPACLSGGELGSFRAVDPARLGSFLQLATGYSLPTTAFWVRFAQLLLIPRPPGFVPPRIAGNRVRFAHFALPGPGRPAELGSFCALHPSQAHSAPGQAGRRGCPAVGLSSIPNPQSRNWVRFASFARWRLPAPAARAHSRALG